MYSLVSKVLSLALAAGIYLATSSEAKTPNVVFILTDDQSDAFWKDYDSEHQPKLRKFLSEQGATVQVKTHCCHKYLLNDTSLTHTHHRRRTHYLQNSFSTTPVCCPSRSSIYTGKYIHNLGVYNNSGGSGGCASLDWQDGPEKDNVAYHLSSLGVKSSFAGKYLNNYGAKNVGGMTRIPDGWDQWFGLQGNSKYYNYQVSRNGVTE